MQNQSIRERSRSPLHGNDGYDDDEQEDMDRFDKSRFDNKSDDENDKSSRDIDRGNKRDISNATSCKVYISNLPYTYKWQDVKDLLKNKVGMVDYVEIFEDENRKSRGCAVVEFRNKELAQLALDTTYSGDGRSLKAFTKENAANRREFQFLFGNNADNKRSVLERIQSRENRSFNQNIPKRDIFPDNEETYGLSVPFLRSLNVSAPLINRIFVANIDFKAEESDLEKVFQLAGKVNSVQLSKDGDGKSRGFAVVEFEHPVHAVQAISMFNNRKYFDREMCVRMDRESGQKKSAQQSSNLPPGLQSIGAGLGINGTALTDVTGIGATSGGGGGPAMPQDTRMPLGNPSPNFNEIAMRMISNLNPMNNSLGGNPMPQDRFNNFGQGQIDLNQARTMGMMGNNVMDNLRVGSSNIQRGGIPGFGNSASSGNGMASLNRDVTPVGNVGSTTGFGVNNPTTSRFDSRITAVGSTGQNFPESYASRSAGQSGLGCGFNVSGGSGSRVEGRSSSSNSGRFNSASIVHIKNLPSDYTWQNLRDMCRDYGYVRFAEITGEGVGLVRFESPASANAAVDLLDKQRFDGRSLEAKML